MKKIMILAGAITMLIGTSIFAKNMDGIGVNQTTRGNYAYSTCVAGRGGHHFSRHCNVGGRMGYVQNKEIESNRIAIMEKRVELRKEMLKDTPDWNKVEKLNQEIASKRASNQTIMMRERATATPNRAVTNS
jgi:hypothetical protein